MHTHKHTHTQGFVNHSYSLSKPILQVLLTHSYSLSKPTLQVLLTHSYSRVVMEVFKEAVKKGKVFKVYVTESQPDKSG